MTVTRSCPACGGTLVSEYHHKIWSRISGVVLECHTCDLLFLAEAMTAKDEVQFYQNYGKHLVARGVQSSDVPAKLYEQMLPAARARLSHIGDFFRPSDAILEVGASVGSFLGTLRDQGLPVQNMKAVEPCDEHRLYAQNKLGIAACATIDDVLVGERYGVVCMFHTFEHIADHRSFLKKVRSILTADGTLIIEVPSRTEPLITLYHLEEFRDFYFQPMHPIVYSPKSLEQVLLANGFTVERIIPYQRYGLDNHVRWLTTRSPGGNEPFSSIIDEKTNSAYKHALERAVLTDTIFAIAHVKK